MWKVNIIQGWIIYVWILSVPHLLHYFISFCALSQALDSFPKLNENHILSILQLPNKFNSHVRVLLVRAVSLWNIPKLLRRNSTDGLLLIYWFTTRFFEMYKSRLHSKMLGKLKMFSILFQNINTICLPLYLRNCRSVGYEWC